MPRSELKHSRAAATPTATAEPMPAIKPKAKPRLVVPAPAPNSQAGSKPLAGKGVVQSSPGKSSAVSQCNLSEPVPELLQVTVGRNIRTARLAAGLTLRQVADLSGILFQYVYKVENGEKNLTLTTMDNLAKALNVSISDLLPKNLP